MTIKAKAHPQPEKTTWSVDWYQHWDSLAFWRPMHWRSFDFIGLEVEFSNDLHPFGYLEIDICILGFGVNITRYPGGEPTARMGELLRMRDEALRESNLREL